LALKLIQPLLYSMALRELFSVALDVLLEVFDD
jgi:hypothetical protein